MALIKGRRMKNMRTKTKDGSAVLHMIAYGTLVCWPKIEQKTADTKLTRIQRQKPKSKITILSDSQAT